MKHDCHYHPAEPARWHCSQCQIDYCARCMPDADTRKRHGLCPRCNRAMRYLGAATDVVPFWNRLGAFFRYPFHLDPLAVIAICTLVPLLLQPDLVGLAVTLLLAVALLKYTYAVISRTAEGHMTPPPLATAFSGGGFEIVFLQILVFVLMGGLVFSAAMIGGPILTMLAVAFLMLALPASIMILAMEHSVMAAVNPMQLALLISRIGWPYFLLYGYLILLTLASGAAQEFAVNHFSPWLAQPLAGFLNSTFTLILFHMLGYLLFQYQEELGFASDLQDGDQGQASQRQPDRSLRLDADIDMNLKDGNYHRVLVLLKDALARDPDNGQRLEQLYRLCAARNDTAELTRYHKDLLGWLSSRNDADGIATVLQAAAAEHTGFRLDDPGLAVSCARVLYHRGRFAQVINLLRDFHKHFPDSDQLAPAYLLMAQTLANGLSQWEKATAFLTFIQKRCTGHPLHSQIESYLAQAGNREPLKGPRATFAVD